MSHVGAPRGRTCSRPLRPVAFLAAGVLTLPVLAACSSGSSGDKAAAADIAPAARADLTQGGTVTWAADSVPETFNVFQADADATTSRVAGAVLPSLFTLDQDGVPRLNKDYLTSAKVVATEPRQVVEYRLSQQAVWSNGREIGAPDFVAQWHALRGKDSAYWTARNAGYDRIEKIRRGASDLDVRVTFSKPYADWKSLFTPLYPKELTGTPGAFNDGARATLKTTAGPFRVKSVDRKAGRTTLVRNPRWWGDRAEADAIVLRVVPMGKRAAELAAGALDVASLDTGQAKRISAAKGEAGALGRTVGDATVPPKAGPVAVVPSAASGGTASPSAPASSASPSGSASPSSSASPAGGPGAEQRALRVFTVRKSLEPAYTQLAMNGDSGPLTDDRVRRAVARAIDRKKLASAVLGPLGLPDGPLGSHLAMVGQPAYRDSSDALGKQDTHEAQALLADAGYTVQGAHKPVQSGSKAGSQADRGGHSGPSATGTPSASGAAAPPAPLDRWDDGKSADEKPNGMPGAYAPTGSAAPSGTATPSPGRRGPARAAGTHGSVPVIGKNGKPLSLRFVLPAGEDSAQLRAVGERIAKMLDGVGITTDVTRVSDDSFFKDYVATGSYDLALYSWPASAYPATDGRPIYAKPQPAADGSLIVEQNYTRVGTDRIDQLFDQAAGELDQGREDALLKQADARIWAAAASVPLYQRPELVAVRDGLRNVGAFGLATPRYQDIGFTGKHPEAAAKK